MEVDRGGREALHCWNGASKEVGQFLVQSLGLNVGCQTYGNYVCEKHHKGWRLNLHSCKCAAMGLSSQCYDVLHSVIIIQM